MHRKGRSMAPALPAPFFTNPYTLRAAVYAARRQASDRTGAPPHRTFPETGVEA